MKKKMTLDYIWELQSDLKEKLTEFFQFSLKILPYLTEFSPQLMACIYHAMGRFSRRQTDDIFPRK